MADITYVRLRETFLYLAVVMDAHSRRVVGWELGEDLRAELALGAFAEALQVVAHGLARLNLEAKLPPDSAATTTLGHGPLEESHDHQA